jgi:hypothetical protein
MRVYHGSYTAIDTIDLEKCEIGRDFGRGFYVTNIREQAEIWAERKGREYQQTGAVTEFEFIENAFDHFHLNTLRFDGYSDEWLDFVLMNRNKALAQPTHDYDIVEGPIADDWVQRKLKKYLQGKIPREQFLEDLSFAKPTHQICFCTSRSLQMIERISNGDEIEWHISDIGEPLVERLMLDTEMDEMRATDAFYTSDTFARLADESTGLHLRPWQEIYDMLRAELPKE